MSQPTDTRTDPATIEAACRRLMAEHAATPKRPAGNAETRVQLRRQIDIALDCLAEGWLQVVEDERARRKGQA